ncbi:MAG: deoxynucleoside kinase [Clostridiales bacterium]|nr:deoxynucleoside kinase [Clostridiales bacterium]
MSTLIAIDGLDGSGKGTQTNMLVDRLKIDGYSVRNISFPMYESDSSAPVRMYLDGKLGTRPSDTNAYAASTFFAVDRYASYKADWKRDYDKLNKIIIANRYTSANAVHQLSKLPRGEWDSFLSWLWDFEFIKLGIPVPDLVVYLELPPELSLELVRKRSIETGQRQDIHEKDADYMARCYEAALFACNKLGWERIKCTDSDGNMRSRESIFHDLSDLIAARTDIVM